MVCLCSSCQLFVVCRKSCLVRSYHVLAVIQRIEHVGCGRFDASEHLDYYVDVRVKGNIVRGGCKHICSKHLCALGRDISHKHLFYHRLVACTFNNLFAIHLEYFACAGADIPVSQHTDVNFLCHFIPS